MNGIVLAAVSASIGIQITLFFLVKLFPASPSAVTALSMPELKAKYQKWLGIMGVLIFVITPPLAYFFYLALNALAAWSATFLPPAEVTFAPMPAGYWGLPAIMLGLAGSGFVLLPLYKWILGSRYPEFLAFWSRDSKMDPIKANLFVLNIVVALALMGVVLGLRPYVQLRGDELAVKTYFSLGEHRYKIADIRRIRTAAHFIAPNGDTVARREYIVSFTGHRSWDTNYMPTEPDLATKRAFIETLAQRARVPIEEVPLFKKHEL